jgi:glycosyltransferase involved in cell wall biosynthesis
VNTEIMRDGQNGLLARDTSQWVDALERLAHDTALRARLGRAARETVRCGYSAEASAAKFAQVVDQLVP